MANGLLSKQEPDVFAGLLYPDPSVNRRGMLLPFLKRTVTDPIDDVSEYEQREFAMPSLLFDPLKGLVGMGQMLRGERSVDPREITKTALDIGMLSAPVGLLGGVPRGAVLGANVGGRKTPTDTPSRLLDDVGIETTQRGNVLEISKIETPDSLRGQGLADQKLDQLIQQADLDGTTLALTPSNAFGANKSRLTKWYKRHGFVPNKGRNKNFTTRESMVRPAKKSSELLDDTASRMQRARDMGKENFAAVENIYNLYFYNQNIPPKTAEKIKEVIQKHTAIDDLDTAEQAMLGPALNEVTALQNAAKNKAKKPRWPSKIDLTTIDGVASALKQKLGGGVISGKPYDSRYFDVGKNRRLRISDHLATTKRSQNNSGEVIVSYGDNGINFDVGDNSLTIPYNDKRLSNREGLQELIDLVESDSI